MDKLIITPGHLTRDIRSSAGLILIQVSLQYPIVTEGKGAAIESLNRCFLRKAENLVAATSQCVRSEAEAAAARRPEALPFQISANFSTTYNASGVFSYFTDVFLYAGGMRGVAFRYGSSSLTQDSRCPLFITSLFPAGTDISQVVASFVGERHGGSPLPIADAFSNENFYLTENGMAVFFHPGMISPVAGGTAVFTIPYDEKGPFSPQNLLS